MPFIPGFTPTAASSIGFHRPKEAEGKKLFYNTTPDYNEAKFTPTDPLNIQVELYLWVWTLSSSFEVIINKDILMEMLFASEPLITKNRVGKIMKMVLPYYPNFQRNKKLEERTPTGRVFAGSDNQQFWRFGSAQELQYGLEHAILEWMPWFHRRIEGPQAMTTALQFEDELRLMRDYSYDDMKELFVNELVHKREI